MWFNKHIDMQPYDFTLVSTVYICFTIVINKDTTIYFVNGKILSQHIKKLTSCKTYASHCLYIYSYYTCTPHMYLWQTKCELIMCITCVLHVSCVLHMFTGKCVHTPNYMQQCSYTHINFLSFTCSKLADTCIHTRVPTCLCKV